jgi:hypothetical protein
MDFVKDEINKIHAPDVTSEHEREVREDIYKWASQVYGYSMISLTFKEICVSYWDAYFKDAGAVRAKVR